MELRQTLFQMSNLPSSWRNVPLWILGLGHLCPCSGLAGKVLLLVPHCKQGMPFAQLLWQRPPGPFPARVAFWAQQTFAETAQNQGHPVAPLWSHLGPESALSFPPSTGCLLPDLWTEVPWPALICHPYCFQSTPAPGLLHTA